MVGDDRDPAPISSAHPVPATTEKNWVGAPPLISPGTGTNPSRSGPRRRQRRRLAASPVWPARQPQPRLPPSPISELTGARYRVRRVVNVAVWLRRPSRLAANPSHGCRRRPSSILPGHGTGSAASSPSPSGCAAHFAVVLPSRRCRPPTHHHIPKSPNPLIDCRIRRQNLAVAAAAEWQKGIVLHLSLGWRYMHDC
jgi:hypothetical protein